MYPNLKGYSPLALACSRSNCDMPSRYCEIILELIKGGKNSVKCPDSTMPLIKTSLQVPLKVLNF